MNLPAAPATPCCGPDCCDGEKSRDISLTSVVQSKYGPTARSSLSSNDQGVHAIAEAFGNSADELASIPSGANLGLSCENPTAAATLPPAAGWTCSSSLKSARHEK